MSKEETKKTKNPAKEESPHVLSYMVKDYMIKKINTVTFDSTVIDGAKAMAADENAEDYAIPLKEGSQ
ncbi:MAG: hypothetical protein QG670_524 [Thermoproteota archaeon]|nr:hypothetical protein [Thermoproteota archaeon]